jgi:hypothetical protein
MTANLNYRVVSVSPNLIQVEVIDVDEFKAGGSNQLSIGSYLKISDHDAISVIAIIQSYKIKEGDKDNSSDGPSRPSFIIDAQPVGFLDSDGNFKRGGQQIAIPPQIVEVAEASALRKIYQSVEESKRFTFGKLAQNINIDVFLDGDRFFGKHIAVVGSTGSGKSCTVAKILQEGMRPSDNQRKGGILNNSHVVIFDLHGEYPSAFPKSNKLNIENLILPFWLLNSEELEEIFIEMGEQNHHNQIAQFKEAVILNKKKYNPQAERVTYDSPLYFSVEEVRQYIYNQNIATKDANTGEIKIEIAPDGIEERFKLFEKIKFVAKKTGAINGGPFAGEFDRFVSRLETKINDERLDFLLRPKLANGKPPQSKDFGEIIRQFIGYKDGESSNVTIIDLSGIPFEVLSIVVSLITRIVFDFGFYFKKIKGAEVEVPILMVFEEAHNYIPNSSIVKYRSVKQSIERVAKEGRKYGISLMIVSQRPSEISDTIFSQCNNIVAMRLTNPSDQNYVKRLLPDSVAAITDSLPSLEKREALIIGDSITMPTIVHVNEISEKPDSLDVNFKTEWDKDWYKIHFENLVEKIQKVKWKKENAPQK